MDGRTEGQTQAACFHRVEARTRAGQRRDTLKRMRVDHDGELFLWNGHAAARPAWTITLPISGTEQGAPRGHKGLLSKCDTGVWVRAGQSYGFRLNREMGDKRRRETNTNA